MKYKLSFEEKIEELYSVILGFRKIMDEMNSLDPMHNENHVHQMNECQARLSELHMLYDMLLAKFLQLLF